MRTKSTTHSLLRRGVTTILFGLRLCPSVAGWTSMRPGFRNRNIGFVGLLLLIGTLFCNVPGLAATLASIDVLPANPTVAVRHTQAFTTVGTFETAGFNRRIGQRQGERC